MLAFGRPGFEVRHAEEAGALRFAANGLAN